MFIESSLRPTKKSPLPRLVHKYHQADFEGFKKEFRGFARDINEQGNNDGQRSREQRDKHTGSMFPGDPDIDKRPGKQKRLWSFTKSLKKDNRYLGVDLLSNLDWKEHIDRTVKKANSVLGFLRRNLRINNRETKSSTYVTLVRPHLEYCASIWSPHKDQYNQKLEMVQGRSARYCTNRYHNTSSVTDILQDLSWASSRENLSTGVCEQHRRRPACASAQSDQRLCYSLFGKYHM